MRDKESALILTNDTPCSVKEENNNSISIYNRVTIDCVREAFCSDDIHCVAACCCRMLTCNDWQKSAGALLSLTLTSCWGGLCVHPGGEAETDGEGDRGRIKLERMENQAISIFSISL